MVDYSRKGTIRIIYYSFILWDLLYIFGTGEASNISVWLQKLSLTSTCQAAVWGTLSFKKMLGHLASCNLLVFGTVEAKLTISFTK